jgi:hypothetical protein
MTGEFDAKQLRPSLTPAEIFGRFFLLGPVFGALVQLFLLNAFLLSIYLSFPDRPSSTMSFVDGPILIFAGMEISGLIQAFFVFLFGLPASLLVAVSAMSSYLVLRRVNFLVVLVAVLAALGLEAYFVPGYYTGYLASHGLTGPWQVGEPDPAPQLAVVLAWVLHFFPAFICFWLVRKERLPPV